MYTVITGSLILIRKQFKLQGTLLKLVIFLAEKVYFSSYENQTPTYFSNFSFKISKCSGGLNLAQPLPHILLLF